MSIEAVLDDYADLERDDLLGVLEFAVLATSTSRSIPLAASRDVD